MVIGLIGGFSVVVVMLTLKFDMGRYLLSITIITVMAFSIVTLVYIKKKQLHIHHWVLSIVLCSYLCY